MIRKATIDDIPSIRAMAAVVFRDTYRDILSEEQMEYMMDWMYSEESLMKQMQERGDVYFIEDGRGYSSVRPDGCCADGRPRYHLEKLYVMPSAQTAGLGRRLFERALDTAREMAGGPCLVELNVNRNNPSVSFYEHMGMRRDRSGDFDIGRGFFMNDYIMAIDL